MTPLETIASLAGSMTRLAAQGHGLTALDLQTIGPALSRAVSEIVARQRQREPVPMPLLPVSQLRGRVIARVHNGRRIDA